MIVIIKSLIMVFHNFPWHICHVIHEIGAHPKCKTLSIAYTTTLSIIFLANNLTILRCSIGRALGKIAPSLAQGVHSFGQG